MPFPWCYRDGATYSYAIKVPVHVDILWGTIVDLEDLPNVVSFVVDFDRLPPGRANDPIVEGTRFKETRRYGRKEYILYKTVTRLQNEGEERALSLGISTKMHGSFVRVENTSTLIAKKDDENNSILILTIAVKWGGIIEGLHDMLCRSCINSLVAKSAGQELDEYCQAAVKRKKELASP